MAQCDKSIEEDQKNNSAQMSNHEQLLSIVSEEQVTLEAKVRYGEKKEICFVFTHAYGPLGGSFDHPIICRLYNYFAHQGYMAVKFNFRGVGNSTGKTSYTGSGEKQDLKAVLNFVKCKSDLSPSHFVLVGYSYGCIPIGAVCAEIPNCIGLIAISYPASVSWALTLWNSRKFANALGSISDDLPILFIMGDHDNFTTVAVLEKFVKSVSKTATINIVSDTDHYWVGREENLLGFIRQWMYKSLDLKPYLKDKFTKKSSESLASRHISSNTTLSSRSSLPAPEPSKRRESPEKRHSIDSQYYSKCQEGIEIIEKLQLHELIKTQDRPQSMSELERIRNTKNTASDSALTLNLLERPTRPPPPIPVSRAESLDRPKKTGTSNHAPRISSEPNI